MQRHEIWRKSTWLLSVILIGIHFLLQVWLYISAHTSSDPEAGLVYAVVGGTIDFPISWAVNNTDRIMWEKKILWHSDDLYVSKFDHYVDRFFGFTKQDVELFVLFVLYLVAGTLQWGIVGFLLQSGWRKLTSR